MFVGWIAVIGILWLIPEMSPEGAVCFGWIVLLGIPWWLIQQVFWEFIKPPLTRWSKEATLFVVDYATASSQKVCQLNEAKNERNRFSAKERPHDEAGG